MLSGDKTLHELMLTNSELMFETKSIHYNWKSINLLQLNDTNIYMSVNYAIIGSDGGLSPVWCRAIIWTNFGLLSIRP